MNAATSRTTPRTSAGSVSAWMAILLLMLFATLAAVGGLWALDGPRSVEASHASDATALTARKDTHDLPLPHDHGVTRNLPDDLEPPGASIAAYILP